VVLHLGDDDLVARADRNRGRRRCRGGRNAYATRLIASVEFLVNTTSSGESAPMKRATFCPGALVGGGRLGAERVHRPRDVAVVAFECSRIASMTWRGFCEVLAESR
jgi:hypothetical protein